MRVRWHDAHRDLKPDNVPLVATVAALVVLALGLWAVFA